MAYASFNYGGQRKRIQVPASFWELSDKKQAEYLNIPIEGPYKPDHYRY